MPDTEEDFHSGRHRGHKGHKQRIQSENNESKTTPITYKLIERRRDRQYIHPLQMLRCDPVMVFVRCAIRTSHDLFRVLISRPERPDGGPRH